jgi:hypothetical protein
MQGSPVGIQTQNAPELDVLQQGRPAVCVIIQQYCSTAFASLRLHSRKEVPGTRLKNILVFLNRLRLKLHKSLIERLDCKTPLSLATP